MKTKEELAALREEVETLDRKLCELTEDELKQVTGGMEDKLGVVPIIFAQEMIHAPTSGQSFSGGQHQR